MYTAPAHEHRFSLWKEAHGEAREIEWRYFSAAAAHARGLAPPPSAELEQEYRSKQLATRMLLRGLMREWESAAAAAREP